MLYVCLVQASDTAITSETSSILIKSASVAAAKRVSFHNDNTAELLSPSPSSQIAYHRKRFASVTEDDIHNYLLHHTGLGNLLEHGDDTDNEYESDVDSLCWSCARVIRNKSKAVPKSLIELSKGKSCMTSLGVTDDDHSIPNPHSLVANYARMLIDDRPRFVETLFRAIKLNKLDVTKILCKIVQVNNLMSDFTVMYVTNSPSIHPSHSSIICEFIRKRLNEYFLSG